MDLSQASSVSGEPKRDAMDATGGFSPTSSTGDLWLLRPAPTREELASMEVELIGSKMEKRVGAGPHSCPSCQLPIRIYGRLVRFAFPAQTHVM